MHRRHLRSPCRIWTHKQHRIKRFTGRYEVGQLVCYEHHDSTEIATLREKQLKKWERPWKLRPVQEANPTWRYLFEDLA